MIIILPKSIKIGGMIFEIKDNFKFAERTDLCGQCDESLGEIRIIQNDPGGLSLNKAYKDRIFLHELLHGIDRIWNNNKLDEETIVRLSNGLLQVIYDNEFLVPNISGRGDVK